MTADRAAIALSTRQGVAVLDLLERASVPPLPVFYRLFYDYVAGADTLLAQQVRGVLVESAGAGNTSDRLYAEFVAPYERHEAVDQAIEAFETRLKILQGLLADTTEACGHQAAALGGAERALAVKNLDAGLVAEWIGHLQHANRRLQRAGEMLLDGLMMAEVELEATRKELEGSRMSSLRDPLTGLSNRAGLDAALGRLLATQREGMAELCCVILDIDHFKVLNDSYGHQMGDDVLRLVSRALMAAARGTDVIGRLGGDEFMLLLPDSGLEAAQTVVAHIRQGLMEGNLEATLGPGVVGSVSASVGIAHYCENDTIASLTGRADRLLYEAKHAGRNRVVTDHVEACSSAA